MRVINVCYTRCLPVQNTANKHYWRPFFCSAARFLSPCFNIIVSHFCIYFWYFNVNLILVNQFNKLYALTVTIYRWDPIGYFMHVICRQGFGILIGSTECKRWILLTNVFPVWSCSEWYLIFAPNEIIFKLVKRN